MELKSEIYIKKLIDTIEKCECNYLNIPIVLPNCSFEIIKVDVCKFKKESDYKSEILKKIKRSIEKNEFFWLD